MSSNASITMSLWLNQIEEKQSLENARNMSKEAIEKIAVGAIEQA